MSNKNEIKGGTRSTYAYAICDDWCGDIYEMSSEVAEQFGHSPYHRWVEVYDIRTNKDIQEEVKNIPKITNEAIHALEMANLRGVRVHVIYLDREFRRKHEQNEELHRELYKTVSLLPSKEWEKVHKILLKHGYNISKA